MASGKTKVTIFFIIGVVAICSLTYNFILVVKYSNAKGCINTLKLKNDSLISVKWNSDDSLNTLIREVKFLRENTGAKEKKFANTVLKKK